MNNSKFKYAPGLPGYGTQGDDGSAGNTGLSIYFSTFSGTETGVLKQRIRNNLLLYGTQQSLPNNRTYTNGDFFIDSNSKIYVITNSGNGEYQDTGQIFQANSPLFKYSEILGDNGNLQRYINDFSGEISGTPRTLDIILSSNPNDIFDYTINIDEMYGSGGSGNYGRDYPHIVYSDVVNNSYNNLMIFATEPNNINSIAITKKDNTQKWHFGNLNKDENLAKVSDDFQLNLDFGLVKTKRNFESSGYIKVGNTTNSSEGMIKYDPGTNDFYGYDGDAWQSFTYSFAGAASQFTQTEVTNLKDASLADGTRPWESNNYYDDTDVESYLSGQDIINFSGGQITHGDSGQADLDSSVNTSGSDIIDYINIDRYGHILDMGTRTLATSDNYYVIGGQLNTTSGVNLILYVKDYPSRFVEIDLSGLDHRYVQNDTYLSSVTNSNGLLTFNMSGGASNRTVNITDESLDFGSNTLTAQDFILTSDIRLKENIEKIEDTKIEKTDIFKFNFIHDEDKRTRYGVSAQELEKTNPELVSIGKEGYKKVSYIDYLLLKVHNLNKENKELKERLNKIEKFIGI